MLGRPVKRSASARRFQSRSTSVFLHTNTRGLERENYITMAVTDITITGWTTRDVRFPTSLDKTGSDAMNAAGDYSAAYCILQTDSVLSGHGMVTMAPPIYL